MPKFERLQVWNKAVELAVYVYQISNNEKLSKDFGMRNQMRRAAISISANIAEGDEMDSNKQSIRYFRISKGSSGELYSHIEIAKRVGMIDTEHANHIKQECISISGMLGNLIKARKKKIV